MAAGLLRFGGLGLFERDELFGRSIDTDTANIDAANLDPGTHLTQA
jgi:hypothetical protein